MDQANTLRKIVENHRLQSPVPRTQDSKMRVIAVTSGKGGVGKTNTVLNLGLALSRMGRKVFLLDADMGLANLDVLLGLTPRYTLDHVISGQRDIMEVVLTGPFGLKILPSSSGISELSEMSFEQQMRLFQDLSRIEGDIDYLFIDTGAGISSNVLRFNASANEVCLVVSPEPTSITDAYALMKLLAIKYHVRDFALIANSVVSVRDAQTVYERLNKVCEEFLKVNLKLLGAVPFDNHIRKAVRQQRALMDAFPNSPAAKSLNRIARLLDQNGRVAASAAPARKISTPKTASPVNSPLSGFWDRLLHWKKVK